MHPINPIEWLCAKAPGFSDLSDEERTAITYFSLLWSFFEAEALQTNASASSIFMLVHKWEGDGRLNISPFASSLSYFRNRYFNNGKLTENFDGLHLRRNDCPELVNKVLKGENTNPADNVSTLLIIVFRLRNNLFHGVKWAYGIRGQLENFTNANEALMAALDTNNG
jgi:hypothetical protein